MALQRKQIPSPNYSSRGGTKVRLIVIHTAQGATTIESLGNYFANPSSQVSSHVGADDKAGVIGEYVKRPDKAWTQGNANPHCVSIELCAFAEWSASEWQKHPNMLANCAAWIAEEAAHFGIPITKLTPSQVTSASGVCQHADLDAYGQDHWDCGGGFPIDEVLEMARGGGEEMEVGYPDEFWAWANWYLTTNRDPDERPAGVPKEIPDAWWEGQKEVEMISKRFGMTAGERDWIDWVAEGKEGPRPNVPQTIPSRWWDDNEWAVKRS